MNIWCPTVDAILQWLNSAEEPETKRCDIWIECIVLLKMLYVTFHNILSYQKLNSFAFVLSEISTYKRGVLRYLQVRLVILFYDVNDMWQVKLHNTQSKFILTLYK